MLQIQEELHVCVLALFALWSFVAGTAAERRLQGVAARCCCQSAVCALGQGRVPLQGAAVRVLLELGCWCSCRVLSQGACVRVTFRLWSLVAGAAALRCCRMPVRVVFALLLPLQGAAAGRCCQSAVCALDAAAGCCFQGSVEVLYAPWNLGACQWRVPLQGAAPGCCYRVLLSVWCVGL